LEPEEITETRIQQIQNQSILEYLINRKNILAKDSAWEDG